MSSSVTSPRWLAPILDATVAVTTLALAWWVRLHTDTTGTWVPQWWQVGLLLAVLQPLGIAVCAWRWRTLVAAPVIAGAVVGGALAAGIVWSLEGLSVHPRGLAASQIWLFSLCALAWRYGRSWWSASIAEDAGPLVSPRRSHPLGLIWRDHRTLLRLLVTRDLRLKYRGSLVGVIWSLANPIVMTATYTLAFTYIFPVRTEGFIFLLLIGILAWTFFAGSAGMATGAIVDSGSLVKSVYFPRLVLPAATVLFNLVQYLLAMAVLLPAMFLWYGIWPTWALLGLPVVLVLLTLFAWGIALLMAATTAGFRDVRHLLDISLQVLFWGTPILYSPASFPGPAAALIVQSPLAPFITAARSLIYDGAWPAPPILVLAALYATVAVAIGLGVFTRLEDRFAESL